MRINVAGSAFIDGMISMNGQNAYAAEGGGGSGGAVNIRCGGALRGCGVIGDAPRRTCRIVRIKEQTLEFIDEVEIEPGFGFRSAVQTMATDGKHLFSRSIPSWARRKAPSIALRSTRKTSAP